MTARWRAAALAVELPRTNTNTMDNKDDWLNKTKVIWMLITVLACLIGFMYLQADAAKIALELPKEKKYFSLEELVPLQSKFSQRMFNGTWISDTEILYSRAGLGGLYLYDVERASTSLFISQELLAQLNTTNVKISPDRKYLLARSDPQTGFRYSSSARYALHEIETNKTTLIADHQHLQLCIYAGEQHSIGYVLDNDVYYLEDVAAGPAAVRLTNDGVPGVIYNGVADWVYEEEVLSSGSAMWFSPKRSKVAVASFNDTEVEIATYFYYGEPGSVDHQYPVVQNLRYPKVGTKNPDVSLKVTGLNGEIKWFKLEAPVSEVSDDYILGTVAWINEDEVSVMWLNRRQNKSVLVICNAEDGICKNEVIREEPNGWIEVTTPEFYGNSFIDVITTPQGGGDEWYHVVKYTRGVPEPTPISTGNRTVIAIMHWNTENDKIYYMSTLDDGPWQTHLWVGGSKSQCITCDLELPDGDICRNAGVSLSPGGKFYALSCHGEGPALVTINRAEDDSPIMTWQDNAALRDVLNDYYLPQQKNVLVSVPGGFKGAVKMLIPPEIDLSNPVGSYPMVVNIYAGPNSVRVADGYGLGYHTYMSTNRSVIYCYVEGRGSGYKGKNTLFSINNRLGTYEVEDVINITKALTTTYPWIDKERIGLWGWSYGGYATAMALTKDTSNVFNCGISVAPVTSWLYYDSIYTERFMGLPTVEDNLAGYEQGDVTLRATDLRGKHFLLMHGNADDNVHYQNAMALARVLQENDIAFEQMSYPDEAHALSGVTKHVYHTIDDYWTRCFNTFNRSGGFIGRHF